MSSFIRKIVQFCLILSLLLFLLEIPIQVNYPSQTWEFGDWHTLKGINAEILLVGGSTMWTGFDADRITCSTGKKTYVLAQDGYGGTMVMTKLKNYLLCNDAPEVIIVNGGYGFFHERQEWYDKHHFLKYLFLDREGLYSTVNQLQGFHWWEFWVPFVRYSGAMRRYFRDATWKNFKPKRKNGFSPTRAQHDPLPEIPFDTVDLARKNFALIPQYSELCENRKIAIRTPVSRNLNERTGGVDSVRFQFESQGFMYIDLNAITVWPDSLFNDNVHLNEHGAKLASNILIDSILKPLYADPAFDARAIRLHIPLPSIQANALSENIQ